MSGALKGAPICETNIRLVLKHLAVANLLGWYAMVLITPVKSFTALAPIANPSQTS